MEVKKRNNMEYKYDWIYVSIQCNEQLRFERFMFLANLHYEQLEYTLTYFTIKYNKRNTIETKWIKRFKQLFKYVLIDESDLIYGE